MNSFSNWIGRTTEQHDLLTLALMHRFRATLDSAETGGIAAQAIHWCLCTPEATTAMLGADGHPIRSDSPDSFLPPIPLPRRMWASSKVDFLRAIAVGDTIKRVSTIADIVEKQGGSGHLVFVHIDHETTAQDEIAVKERQTVVYRAPSSEPAIMRPADAELGFDDWQFHHSLTPSETLLFRYSALTFNSHRIHYDAPYAMNEEGYRGLVVHGPLTATLLLDLATREYGANALKSFAFRGMSPAFVGEPLHLVGKRDGDEVTLAALGGDGRTIMAAEAVIG